MGDSDDGIITRSVMYLFDQLAARNGSTAGSGAAAGAGAGAAAGAGAGDGCRYSLRVSFAEIYNEQIYDLIRFDRRQLAVSGATTQGRREG